MATSRSKRFFLRNNLLQIFGTLPKPPVIEGKERFLIINGDDLCKDENTTRSIVKAYKQGILTSTSAFINMEDSVDQLIKVHQENPDLDIGLHLNLTLGSPVSDQKEVAGLTDKQGSFYDIDRIIRFLPYMKFREVQKELFAQAELFVSSGVPMSHINYHHHLAALYTPFFKTVREIALKYHVPLRNPVPASIYQLISLEGNGGGGSEGVKKLLRFAITHPFKIIPLIKKVSPDALINQKNLMFAEGIKSTNWFIDSFYKNATVSNFKSILEQLPAGVSELVCHPGLDQELEVLTDESLKAAIAGLGINLVSWEYFNQTNYKWKN
jgi:predicted glycoside hydrolase/deacetylase ChbG (UPF0249 family)